MDNKNISLYVLVTCVILLMTIGNLAIFSASKGVFNIYVKKHLLSTILSILVSIFIMRLHFSLIYNNIGSFYISIIVLLCFTTLFGHKAMGAKRWIYLGLMNFQPSEFMKIAMLLMLARCFHTKHHSQINKANSLLLFSIIVLIPLIIILKQPNLGTASIMGLSAIVLLYLAGIKQIYFFF